METYPKYIEQYPLESITLNDWNPNRMDDEKFRSLVMSIRKRKFLVPIVVNKDGVVMDGEHRYLASKECGLENVPVVQVDMTLDEMKLGTLGLNGIRGENSPLSFAKLLQDLNQRYSLEEIADLIGFGVATIKDKLELLKIPDDIVKKLQEEAAMKEQELPVVLNFVLSKKESEYVLSVLDACSGKSRSERLISLCGFYLSQKNINENEADENQKNQIGQV